jgi:hypothetical protein
MEMRALAYVKSRIGLRRYSRSNADTTGASYIALEAEQEPLIPNCVLVSPAHHVAQHQSSPTGWTVYDDHPYAAIRLLTPNSPHGLGISKGDPGKTSHKCQWAKGH